MFWGRIEAGKNIYIWEGRVWFWFIPKTASTASSSTGALVAAGSLQPMLIPLPSGLLVETWDHTIDDTFFQWELLIIIKKLCGRPHSTRAPQQQFLNCHYQCCAGLFLTQIEAAYISFGTLTFYPHLVDIWKIINPPNRELHLSQHLHQYACWTWKVSLYRNDSTFDGAAASLPCWGSFLYRNGVILFLHCGRRKGF
jgi:hypothetical protein